MKANPSSAKSRKTPGAIRMAMQDQEGGSGLEGTGSHGQSGECGDSKKMVQAQRARAGQRGRRVHSAGKALEVKVQVLSLSCLFKDMVSRGPILITALTSSWWMVSLTNLNNPEPWHFNLDLRV